MCDYGSCEQPSTVAVEPGILLCSDHGLKKARANTQRHVCRYCFVPIESPANPVGEHKPRCPRAKVGV